MAVPHTLKVLVCAIALLACPASACAGDLAQSDRDFDVDFEADEVLALNMSSAGRAAARSLRFRIGTATPLRNLRLWITRLRAPPGINARAAVEKLRAADPQGVYSVNETYALAEGLTRCDPERCYGPALVGWAACGAEVRLGMVDSAVDVDAPNLRGRRVTVKRFSPGRGDEEQAMHGSAIASLLVGGPDEAPIGLLPRAHLFAADVFSRGDDGQLATDALRLASGLDWLAGHKLLAINMSLEGPNTKVLEIVTRRLVEDGVAVVAAAGNSGPEGPAAFPASYPPVVAVTAVDRYRQAYARASRGAYVDLAAPGVGVWTTDAHGNGVLEDGTSFATPFVTAAIGQWMADRPGSSPLDAAEVLKRDALDLGVPGPDPVFGAGLLRVPACAAPAPRE